MGWANTEPAMAGKMDFADDIKGGIIGKIQEEINRRISSSNTMISFDKGNKRIWEARISELEDFREWLEEL